MILNTGSRTDIPAFYSEWFANRLREGFCLVRNPYNPSLVTRYRLDPSVVDVLSFCSKNPLSMLAYQDLLKPYRQFWHVTITPYGRDIEPHVPPAAQVLETFRRLSEAVGKNSVVWRYDPVFISKDYSVDFHIRAFRQMARTLHGYTGQCVVSFIDLYEKTMRNFPGVRRVTSQQQEALIAAFAETAQENHMQIHLCCESASLARPGVDADGCFSQSVLEKSLHIHLQIPKTARARSACPCLLGADIGAYNTCSHGCLYCYANYDAESVCRNRLRHDPSSPMLIGHLRPEDTVREAEQRSFLDPQMTLDDLLSGRS